MNIDLATLSGTGIAMFVAVVAARLAATTAGVVAAGLGELARSVTLPRLSMLLPQAAATWLPTPHRARYVEEWRAELADLRGLRRLRHGFGLLTRAPLVSWELRHQATPRRGRHQYVVPMANIAGIAGWLAGAALIQRERDGGVRYRLQYARRQGDDVRVVVLTRLSKDDSAYEIEKLFDEAVALGAITRKVAQRKALRVAKKVTW